MIKKYIISIIVGFVLAAVFLIIPIGSDAVAHAAGNGVFVVINPGHGPTDPGAVANGYTERDLNEKVAVKLGNKLRSLGYTVFLTNKLKNTSTDLPCLLTSDPNPNNSYGGTKYDFSTELLPAINTPWNYSSDIPVGRKPDLVISLHHNDTEHGYPDTSASGYEIYYSRSLTGTYGKTERTIQLSSALASSVDAQFRSGGFYLSPRSPSIKTNEVNSITKYSGSPSILIEAGFVSNPNDLALITQDAKQNILADRITAGVQNFVNTYADTAPPTMSSVWTSDSPTYTPYFALYANVDDNSSGVKSVEFYVCPQKNNWSNYKVYNGGNYTGNTWQTYFSTSDFGYAAGQYDVQIYGTDNNGNRALLGLTSFVYLKDNTPPTMSSVRTSESPTYTPYFAIMADVADNYSGVKNVEFYVCPQKNNWSNYKVYNGGNYTGNTWQTYFSTSDFGNVSGQYDVQIYGTDNNGNRGLMGFTSFALLPDNAPPTALAVYSSPTPTNYPYFNVYCTGVSDPSGIDGVEYYVWSETGGQDDIKCYKAENTGGNDWNVNVYASNHKNDAGIYCVDIYATDRRGNKGFIGGTRIDLQFKDAKPPVMSGLSTSTTPSVSTDFTVNANVTDDKSAVKNVDFYVWSRTSNQADIKMYSGVNTSGSNWQIKFNTKDFGNKNGVYDVHIYATDANGNRGFIGSTTVELLPDNSPPTVSAIYSSPTPTNYPYFNVYCTGVSDPSGIDGVEYYVWSETGGQDDIKCYKAENTGGNDWNVNVYASNHKNDAGIYCVDIYATDKRGNKGFIGGARMNLQFKDTKPPVMSGLSTSTTPSVSTDFTVNTNVTDDKSAVKNVDFYVWSRASNQADIKIYSGVNTSGSNWQLKFNTKDFGNKSGIYDVHIYAADANGNRGFIGSTTVELLPDTSAPTAGAVYSSPTPTIYPYFNVFVTNVADPSGIAGVEYYVWSETGGQDDIKCYKAETSDGSTYNVNVYASNHNYDTGIYNVHIYATDKRGNKGFIGGAQVDLEFKDTKPPTGTVSRTTASPTFGTAFGINAQVNDDISGVSAVKVAVWSTVSNQTDLKWYTMDNSSGNTWSKTIDLKDFGNKTSVYLADVYATDKDGNTGFIGEASVELQKDTTPPTAAALYTSGSSTYYPYFSFTAAGVSDAESGIDHVRFAVWTEASGQDDLKWYDGQNNGNGDWDGAAYISEHNGETGVYNIHAYATNKQGNEVMVGQTTVKVLSDTSPPSVENLTPATADVVSATFDVYAYDTTDPSGVKAVEFAVWSDASGQTDLKWYNGVQVEPTTWKITANITNNSGIYQIHVYTTDQKGNRGFAGSTTVNVKPEALVYLQYPIIGTSQTSVDQLVRYFQSSGKTYPALYVQRGVDLTRFCTMYMQEAAAEGVKAEVAFAQMVHETGWLQYGGKVPVEYFNFAGLGALNSNLPGQCADFRIYGDDANGIAMGIRAHIQHLKCYASTAPLANPLVDPRWDAAIALWGRGSAPTVESLSGKWATGPGSENYGTSILQKVASVLSK
jgi:N-acetylmuramoyl-L-alanine amidase